LFAWMTEMLLYRVNQVPVRNYIKFLDMIGVHLEPPKPARTEITFLLTAPQPYAIMIPMGTEVSTRRTALQSSITFATERTLSINPPFLQVALVSRDESTYHEYTPVLRNPQMRVPIFEDPPQPGNGFYLGYQGNLAGHVLLLTLECEIQGIGVDPKDPPLVWEYYDGNLQTWRTMLAEMDTTGGLNKNGEVIVHIPTSSRPRELDRRRASWIRCRIEAVRPGQRPYATAPRVLSVETVSIGGIVMAGHSQTISGEQLGRSDGTVSQTFTLSSHPVLPRRTDETLEVETDEPGVFVRWDEVRGFVESRPDDLHFTCDSTSGGITLGPSVRLPNGDERFYGAVPQQGRALRFTRYRIGGGTIGNVGASTLTALKTSIPYIAAVTNAAPAVGGTEAETLETAMIRGPHVLRDSPRAVTASDFERLAVEATPDVVRARCVYVRDADDGPSGRVRLVLVPRIAVIDGVVPLEQLALSDTARTAVQIFLDERRMLTVRLSLESPEYVTVVVRSSIFTRRGADVDEVRQEVEAALYRFIHPTTGGAEGTGWPFGRSLFVSDIYALLGRLAGVEYVGAVAFAVVNRDGTLQPVGGEAVKPRDLAVFCSGAHQTTVQRTPQG